jgi:hypothetical protein
VDTLPIGDFRFNPAQTSHPLPDAPGLTTEQKVARIALGAGKEYGERVINTAKDSVLTFGTLGLYAHLKLFAWSIHHARDLEKAYDRGDLAGAGISVLNRFNPLYHIGEGVAGTVLAVQSGDWENAGREGFKVGVTTGTVIAGAVTGGVKAMERGGGGTRGAPRNAQLAGKTHPRTGVPFDTSGYPDFKAAGAVKTEVKITPTGSRSGDFRAANQAAGFAKTPEGYSWHHHQNGTTMQLVPTDIHRATGHTGGFAPGR